MEPEDILWLVGYFLVGLLFQYMAYGNTPLDVACLIHVIFWPLILAWWMMGWILVIFMFALVGMIVWMLYEDDVQQMRMKYVRWRASSAMNDFRKKNDG